MEAETETVSRFRPHKMGAGQHKRLNNGAHDGKECSDHSTVRRFGNFRRGKPYGLTFHDRLKAQLGYQRVRRGKGFRRPETVEEIHHQTVDKHSGELHRSHPHSRCGTRHETRNMVCPECREQKSCYPRILRRHRKWEPDTDRLRILPEH